MDGRGTVCVLTPVLLCQFLPKGVARVSPLAARKWARHSSVQRTLPQERIRRRCGTHNSDWCAIGEEKRREE
jgi:hypothetical protein